MLEPTVPIRSLVDVKTVAAYLAVDRSWVYENADLLGARRLGSGPKARLRFSIAEVDERLTSGLQSRRSEPLVPAQAVVSRRRPRRSLGTTVETLPIRGERRAA
jgi:hypothetical protein